MRLICPDCAAQYEVDDTLIPDEGRDVHCSSCGAEWVEGGAPAEAPEGAAPAAVPRTAPPQDEIPRRREIDPRIREILREEAEREAAARRAGPPAERHDAPAPAPRTADRNGHVLRKSEGDAPRPVDGGAPDAAADERKNALLPDIAEINSTLSPRPRRRAADDDRGGQTELPAARPPRRTGFALGFGLSAAVVAILVLLAAFAAPISAALPQVAPAIRVVADLVGTLQGAAGALLGRAGV